MYELELRTFLGATNKFFVALSYLNASKIFLGVTSYFNALKNLRGQ